MCHQARARQVTQIHKLIFAIRIMLYFCCHVTILYSHTWLLPILTYKVSASYLQCGSRPSLPGPGLPLKPTWSVWFSGVWVGSRATCLQDREPGQCLHHSPLAGCALWVCLSVSPSPSCGRKRKEWVWATLNLIILKDVKLVFEPPSHKGAVRSSSAAPGNHLGIQRPSCGTIFTVFCMT